MKDVSLRIGNFPAVSEPRLHAQMLVSRQQVIEQQAVNSLRLGIEPNPRVKISRAEFDDHHQCVSIGTARTSEKKTDRNCEDQNMEGRASRPPIREDRSRSIIAVTLHADSEAM